MESDKKTGTIPKAPLANYDKEMLIGERASVAHNNTGGDMFTSQCLGGSSRQNGPLVPQASCSSISTSCSSSENGNGADLDTRNTSQEASASEKCVDFNSRPSCSKHNDSMADRDQKYNIDLSVPTTSGVGRSKQENAVDNYNNVGGCKRPMSLKLKRSNNDDNESSSDTGNEDYSLGSEDGCIYTYRGGEHLADLPSSFVSLDMGLPQDNHLPMLPNYPVRMENAPPNRDRNSRESSPDMDFLEMDFDPGPSCEVDTGDESSPDVNVEVADSMPVDEEPVLVKEVPPEPGPSGEGRPLNKALKSQEIPLERIKESVVKQSESIPSASHQNAIANKEPQLSCNLYGKFIIHTNTNGEKLLVRRTISYFSYMPLVNFHHSIGMLGSPEIVSRKRDMQMHSCQPIDDIQEASTSTAVIATNNAKKKIVEIPKQPQVQHSQEDPYAILKSKHITNKHGEYCIAGSPSVMLFDEKQADEQQEKVSHLGQELATVVNVFDALGVPTNVDKIYNALPVKRKVPLSAPLPRYLLHRSIESYTASDLISCIHNASEGRISARFFSTFPERVISLSHWIADWLSLGAVAILTKNAQNEGEIRAQFHSWHHQMVYGVSQQSLYLLSPRECTVEEMIWPQLLSPPVLLVHVNDIWSRFTPDTDLAPLAFVPDERYQKLNVLGQVVHAIREYLAKRFRVDRQRGKYITLPSACNAGITIAALTGSEAHRILERASPMPLLAHASSVQLPDLKSTRGKECVMLGDEFV